MDKIFIGDGFPLCITHIGTVIIDSSFGPIKLINLLCVPDIRKNLISMRQFSSDFNCNFLIDDFDFILKNKDCAKTILIGSNRDGPYQCFHYAAAYSMVQF